MYKRQVLIITIIIRDPNDDDDDSDDDFRTGRKIEKVRQRD